MQNLFDLPTTTSLSYLFAIAVVFGLIVLFAMVVRRIASLGLLPDGNRGRGPRLGIVDTFSLDRNRQLVIVRRDDVEHLLMIGGTNDILIESNIVRAIAASSIRESQSIAMAQFDDQANRALNIEETIVEPQNARSISASQIPEPSAQVQPATQQPQTLRLKAMPQTAEPVTPSPQPARQGLSEQELQVLAKRLEASMPPLAPKAEIPAAAPAAVTPMTVEPINKQPVLQQQAIQPGAPTTPQPSKPVTPQLQPQPMPKPADQHTNIPTQAPVAPVMPQPRAPIMPQATPMPAPLQMAPIKQMQMQPVQPAPFNSPAIAPIQQPQHFPQVEAPQVTQAPAQPKDPQAAALDENLRRLLGRKLDPR